MVMYRLAVTFLVIRESFLTATDEVLLAIIRALSGIGNVGAEDLGSKAGGPLNLRPDRGVVDSTNSSWVAVR